MASTSTRAARVASPHDSLNKSIIEILSSDGRTPFAEVASALGVSEGTIRNRVNWMKESGLLRIVAIADPRVAPYQSDAMLGIKLAAGHTPQAVAERLGACPEVVYILWVSGRYDLLVEIVCESDADFLEFLSKQCFDQEDVASLEVMTGLAMYKNQFLLKQDFP